MLVTSPTKVHKIATAFDKAMQYYTVYVVYANRHYKTIVV